MYNIVRTARGPIKWFLKLFGYKAITTPWNRIYILAGYENDTKLVNHELVHIEQMFINGKFKFLIKYFYYLIRYGYKNNPFEIEARERTK